MNDTSKEFADFQNRLIMNMTPEERFRMGCEMADDGMRLLRAGIITERGNLSEKELKLEVLRRLKKYDSSLWWLDL